MFFKERSRSGIWEMERQGHFVAGGEESGVVGFNGAGREEIRRVWGLRVGRIECKW